MTENSRPGDWVGTLALAGDLTGLIGVEAIGSGGLYFSTRWDASLGLVFVSPGARADYESFAGANPVLTFALRLNFASGAVQDLPTQYQVTVLDRDDTAPSALRWATGGAVTAGAIGANIGTLAVTDPDSAGPFYFSFAAEDDWRFEVVGTTLKLRDGVSLGLDETPGRPIFIEVSDGHQSASFALDLTVRTPTDQQSTLPLLAPGETLAGFTLDSSGTMAMTMREARHVTTDNVYGGNIHQLVAGVGQEVWLSAVDRIQLADGYVDYAADSLLARAAALQAALPVPGGGAALAQLASQAAAGTAWVELAAPLDLAGVLSDAAYVAQLFADMLDRAPSDAELALHGGRLASGTSRAQLAVDVAMSPDSLALQAATHEGGHWAFTATGSDTWRTDPGGLGQAAGGAPPQATEGVWVM